MREYTKALQDYCDDLEQQLQEERAINKYSRILKFNGHKVEICQFNPYCMCHTCTFLSECKNCYDCIRAHKYAHDVCFCSKYERKEVLRMDFLKDIENEVKHVDRNE